MTSVFGRSLSDHEHFLGIKNVIYGVWKTELSKAVLLETVIALTGY